MRLALDVRTPARQTRLLDQVPVVAFPYLSHPAASRYLVGQLAVRLSRAAVVDTLAELFDGADATVTWPQLIAAANHLAARPTDLRPAGARGDCRPSVRQHDHRPVQELS